MYREIVKNVIIFTIIILLFIVFALSLFVFTPKAHAGEFVYNGKGGSTWQLTPQENLCFLKAAAMYQVPVNVLKSIAKVESGYNPYALNIEGDSFLPKSESQAWAIIRSNYYRSMDIGIMQVNTYWFKLLNVPYWYGLDTCYNIMLGAYVLRNKIDRFGNNWFGIAAYHSANPISNNRYAWMLWHAMRQQTQQYGG